MWYTFSKTIRNVVEVTIKMQSILLNYFDFFCLGGGYVCPYSNRAIEVTCLTTSRVKIEINWTIIADSKQWEFNNILFSDDFQQYFNCFRKKWIHRIVNPKWAWTIQYDHAHLVWSNGHVFTKSDLEISQDLQHWQ